ncbi:MAG: hypothetical protein NVSMB49_01390 [Ktedonobacteraceae bacterium]
MYHTLHNIVHLAYLECHSFDTIEQTEEAARGMVVLVAAFVVADTYTTLPKLGKAPIEMPQMYKFFSRASTLSKCMANSFLF